MAAKFKVPPFVAILAALGVGYVAYRWWKGRRATAQTGAGQNEVVMNKVTKRGTAPEDRIIPQPDSTPMFETPSWLSPGKDYSPTVPTVPPSDAVYRPPTGATRVPDQSTTTTVITPQIQTQTIQEMTGTKTQTTAAPLTPLLTAVRSR